MNVADERSRTPRNAELAPRVISRDKVGARVTQFALQHILMAISLLGLFLGVMRWGISDILAFLVGIAAFGLWGSVVLLRPAAGWPSRAAHWGLAIYVVVTLASWAARAF